MKPGQREREPLLSLSHRADSGLHSPKRLGWKCFVLAAPCFSCKTCPHRRRLKREKAFKYLQLVRRVKASRWQVKASWQRGTLRFSVSFILFVSYPIWTSLNLFKCVNSWCKARPRVCVGLRSVIYQVKMTQHSLVPVVPVWEFAPLCFILKISTCTLVAFSLYT